MAGSALSKNRDYHPCWEMMTGWSIARVMCCATMCSAPSASGRSGRSGPLRQLAAVVSARGRTGGRLAGGGVLSETPGCGRDGVGHQAHVVGTTGYRTVLLSRPGGGRPSKKTVTSLVEALSGLLTIDSLPRSPSTM